MKTSTELTQRRTDALALLEKKIQESALSMEEGQRTQLLQRSDSNQSPITQQHIDAWAVRDKKALKFIASVEESKRDQLLQQYEAIRTRRYQCFLAAIDSEALVNSFAKVSNIESMQATTLAMAAPTSGSTRYVSPQGDDNNLGTQTAPFRTIQRAINTGAGMIRLADGTYEGFHVPGFSMVQITGNINNPGAVIINGNGSGTVISNGLGFGFGFLSLSGMTITGGGANDNQAVIELEDSFFTSNIIITSNQSNRAIIAVTALQGFSFQAIYLQNTLMYNNSVVNNGSGIVCGVDVADTDAEIYLENSTIADNIAPGTITVGNSVMGIMNSILYNPLSDIEIGSQVLHTFSFISYSNVRNVATLTGKIWICQGVLDVEPLFVSPEHGMYQLADNSPCIDAGSISWVTNDAHLPPAKGTLRNDMGAYGGSNVSAQSYQIVSIGSVQYSYDTSGNRAKRELA